MLRSWILVLSVHAGVASAAFAQTPTPQPTDLAQYQSDGSTVIAVGGEVNQSATVVITGIVYADADLPPTTKYRLEVEVRATTTSFSGATTHTGNWVSAGSMSTVIVSGLQPGQTYHWQARERTS